jgi:hypothetical protein
MYGHKIGPMRDRSPCADCKDRVIGCHGKCVPYAEWRAELERVKNNRKAYIRQRFIRYKNFKEETR